MNYIAVKGLAERTLKIVGTRPLRPDGVDKVTGRAKFGADLHVANMRKMLARAVQEAGAALQ